MAVLVGMRGQRTHDELFDASGTIAVGSTPQLILPAQDQRSMLFLQNISATVMYVEFGPARATAALTSGVVTSLSIANAGFSYNLAPKVIFYGGGSTVLNPSYYCPGLPGNQSPSNVAQAIATVAGGAVTALTITNGGSGYVKAPYVYLQSSDQDPYGCAIPSATSGVLLAANGGSIFYNGTSTPTSAIGVFCTASTSAFVCKWML